MTAERKKDVNGCGAKHGKLAMLIIGAVIGVLVLSAVGGVSLQSSFEERFSRQYEARLRAVERDQAVISTKLDAIHETLKKVETKLDKLTERKNP